MYYFHDVFLHRRKKKLAAERIERDRGNKMKTLKKQITHQRILEPRHGIESFCWFGNTVQCRLPFVFIYDARSCAVCIKKS